MTLTEQISRTNNLNQIAPRIVNECLRVQPGEQVTVLTWDHTLDYAEALALEIEKASGISTTTLMGNKFYWSYLKDVPEEQFARRQKGFLSLLDQTDAMIQLGGPQDPSEYTRIPKERAAKMIQGQQAIGDKFVERKIRTLTVPIGLVTKERARTYGFDYENWLRIFNNGIDVDYSKIAKQGEALATKLRAGKSVRLTSDNGTDLRFQLKGRPVHVNDGILDRTDSERGTLFETLPSGVLENAPDENSAEGVVQFDQPSALAGKMLRGLKWEFKHGHLMKYGATANLDSFRELYESAQGDKDRFSRIAIGLNPRSEPIGFFSDRLVQGMVSVGIGGNNGIGGDIKMVYGSEGSLKNANMEIDGSRIITNGRINT